MFKVNTPSVAYNMFNAVNATNTPVKFSGLTPIISTQDSFIDVLVQESQHWFDNAYRTSNDQLYSLLTKCYGYYHEMGKTGDTAKALRQGLQVHIEGKALRFNSGTHTLNKIVKCVFGFDRRRVSAYGSVLKFALQLNITVNELAQFIIERGGIEEIRLGGKPTNAVPTLQKANEVAISLESVVLGQVAHKEISQQLDAGKIGKNTLLVGTWQADGSIVIKAVIDNDSLVKTALATQYNKNLVSLVNQAPKVAAKGKKSTRTSAVNKAAEQALLAA